MRLILVLLGADGPSPRIGIKNRTEDCIRLLDYGFDNFTTVKIAVPKSEVLTVWMGTAEELLPKGPAEVLVTVPKGRESHLKAELTQSYYATAPIPAGEVLGHIRVFDGEKTVYSGDLVAPEAVDRGPWYTVFFDSVLIFFRKLFGLPV